MKYEKYCYLTMPKGELEKPAYDALRKIGYKIPEANGKSYQTIVDDAPLILLKGRASDVPTEVFAEDSVSVAGITGSDILWEEGYNRGRIGTEVPIELFFPEVKQPELYLGVTKSFSENIQLKTGRDVIPMDLSGKILFSKYVRVASDYLADSGVKDVDIRKRGGSIEGMQYNYPEAVSLVDIWVSGKTAIDNDIVRATTIAPVVTTLFENPNKASAFELRVINDIREKLFVEEQRLRTPTTGVM